MKNNHQLNSHCKRLKVSLLASSFLAALFVIPTVFGANGTTQYIDVNGTTAGFGTPSGTINQTDASWSTDPNGLATPVAFVSTDAMALGSNFTDLASSTFSVNLNSGSDINGVVVNAGNVSVTLTGSANTHPTTSSTWFVTNTSLLTLDDTRQAFDSGSTVKGLNWNNQAVTFTGSGTFDFLTPFGCNSPSAVQTENMPGGVINLQMSAPSLASTANTYKGGFTLTAGTLNFASAGSAYAFSGLTNGQFLSINGGTIDNTSGSGLALSVGTYSGNAGGSIKLGGNFTFMGSASLDLGPAAVINTANHTITVVASTLAIGGAISGSGFGLTKVGNGTLLLYGVSTYSGTTVVGGGTLALTNAGSIAASTQLVVSNATFDVSGLAGGSTTLAGYSPSNSTLTVAAVSGAVTNVMTAALNVGGATNFINVTAVPLVTSYPATFHIIKGATLTGTLNFGLGTVPSSSPAFTGYITNLTASASVDLILTGGPAPVRALTWSGLNGGSPNGTWDVANTPNWLDASSSPTTFNQLDLVTFNDTAAGQTTVNLSATLTPGSLTVSNNVLPYVFTGGSLSDGSGSLSLTKQGSGTLLLQESSDNFSGAINANGGTVIIDNNSSGITGGANIGANGTLQVGTNDTAGVSLPSGTLIVNGSLVFNSQNNFSVANTITGSGTVSQIQTNVVTLSGASSGNWSLNIQNGTLQSQNNAALGSIPGGIVTVTNGGTFDVGGDGTQNDANFGNKQFNIAGSGVGGNGAIINSAGVQQQDAFQNVVLGADATIGGPNRWDIRGGSPILDLATHTLTKTNGNQISMVSPHVTSGNIVIQEGILSFESTPNFDASAGTITANTGGYVGQYKDTLGSFTRSIVLNGGGTTNISGNGSIAYLDAPILFAANSTVGSSGGTEVFNGVISDGGNGFPLTLVGSGTNQLAAANTYSGITTVQGTLGLTNHGSIFNTPVIILTNGAGFDISGLAAPFSGTNALWVGDDLLGNGIFNLGKTLVTNFNYLSISNAVVQMAVANPNVPCITVTNLNLGDAGASSTINITALPILLPSQFPLIKYANVTGTYNLGVGTLPNGFSGTLVNNTANNSIDLQITGLPGGIWNGGDSAVDNNWSDSVNWSGTGLSGSDALNFTGTAGLNNTNDLGFTENANYITFLPGAGAFILNGNPVTLQGGVTNNSANLQSVDIGLSYGGNGTNISFDGGSAGLIIGNGLTNTFGTPGYTTLTLAGAGLLTNLLNSTTSPGGTNIVLLNGTNANWTLVDNAASAPMTVPWNFQINAGTFNFGAGSSAPTLTNASAQGLPQDNQVGGTAGLVGTLNISNGTWTTIARLNTALGNNCTGIVSQVGGTLNIGNQFQGANAGDTNAQSIVNISGGTMNINGGTGIFYVASRDYGALTVTNTGTLNCGNLDISRNANGNTRGSVGVVNLNGGTIACSRVGSATANAQTNGIPTSQVFPTAAFNFNGGTLKARGSATNFFQGSVALPTIPITTTVKAGGAIIDDGGFAISVLEPLQHDSTLGATPDGGFIKKGAGTNTFTAASTYTGGTVVSNGTLVINGSLAAASAVTVTANGTLSGIGTVGGPVTVNGTITPGNPGTNGLLTCSANVTINGAALMKLNNLTNDALVAGGTLTYGGTLNVPLLAGTPALNNSFKLFTAGSYSGNFTVTNLPALGSGLAWNWNPANGTLSVVSGVNLNPTNIVVSVSGSSLTLSWPADHIGWTLQSQTNSLNVGLNPNPSAWVTVPGSTTVDSVNIMMDPNQPTVFYRLQHN